MLVPVILCILSTMAFCVSARFLIQLSATPTMSVKMLQDREKFSMRAQRVARSYACFALAILSLMFFASMVQSYLELFSINFF